ncbi:hypothetical protein [Spirosoma aerolatum]|uniref:hypothetical protein n=1 Tax=Spirosoma aerolatum TaxID=1211326 RepID=UPI0009ADB4F0|nr:hypothetical protein [Spirosoma aerolatum]
MTITSFETNLYQHLAPFFSDHAYALLTEKKQFRRVTSNGFQNIILTSVFYPDDTTLEVNFGCRHEQVEQIAQQFLNNQPDLRPDANTLILSMSRFVGFQKARYKIHSEADLSQVCSQIEDFFSAQGFDFLATAASLPTLDRLLNEYLDEPCRYVYNQTHRCYKGLIAARLNHNPNFDDLVDYYRHLLIHQTQNPYEQMHFERLIAYLQHYSAN